MMWLFWLIAAFMVLMVLWILLSPLLRRVASAQTLDHDKRVAVYRQQFHELEQDRVLGVLSDEHYHQAKEELERRLLEEVGQTSPVSNRPAIFSKRMMAGGLLFFIPLFSVGLYSLLGNPFAIIHPSASLPVSNDSLPHQVAGGLEALSEGLKNKLAQNPDNGSGWALLARSYVEIRRHAEAIPAFESALKYIPNDAQLVADYADALGVVHGGTLKGKSALLIQQALAIDPKNLKALLLSATLAFQQKEYAQAVTVWEHIMVDPQTDQDVLQEVQANIAETKGLLGGGIPAFEARPISRTAPVSLAIRGTVTLAKNFGGKGSATDTLFVFARAVNGPPMPVAIVRATKQDLPFTFQLDDSRSVMPGNTLSQAGEVIVVARLSKSGEAVPTSGDLQGQSQPVKPGMSGLNIVIDSEIP
jgi:cytochrome c-type biogenesis protein CcmH